MGDIPLAASLVAYPGEHAAYVETAFQPLLLRPWLKLNRPLRLFGNGDVYRPFVLSSVVFDAFAVRWNKMFVHVSSSARPPRVYW